MMKKPLTTSIAKLSSLFQIIEEHGVSRQEFLTKNNIDPSVLISYDNRLTLEEIKKLTYEAVSITGDDFLGLHQGERFLGFSNVLGYVMLNCKNLGHALTKLTQYQKICDEGTSIKLEQNLDSATVKVNIPDPKFKNDQHLTDYRLAGTYGYLKKLTDTPFKLIEAWISHPRPSQIKEYERIFQCPVKFDSPDNALIFQQRYLDLPIPQHDLDLLKTLELHAQKVIYNLKFQGSISHKVANILALQLEGGTPSINLVADELAMSVRSLQSKLSNENTTFSDLLGRVRKNLAISYLRHNQISVTEVAYLLGYSEVSVFYRAFKKWTNATPIQFRLELFNPSAAANASPVIKTPDRALIHQGHGFGVLSEL